MQGFLIWGAFTVGVAAFCVWRPQAARTFIGLFFGAMGLGIHGALIATNPQSYVDFAASAPWAIYRDIGRGLLGAIVFLIGITPLGLEEFPNVVLAAGIAFLLTQEFPTDAWTMLRRHRRPKLTTAAAEPPRPVQHSTEPEMTTRSSPTTGAR